MKMGLKVKLLGSFLIVLLLMGVVAYMGLNMGSQMDKSVQQLGKDRLVKVELIGQMNAMLSDFRRYQIQYTNFAKDLNKTEVDNYIKKMDETQGSMNKVDEQLASIVKTAEGQKFLGEYHNQMKQYVALDAQVDKLIQAGQYDAAMDLNNTKGLDEFNGANDALDGFKKYNDELTARAVEDADKNYANARNITIITIVIAVLAGFGLGLILSLSITKVVNQMLNMLKDMAESGGDLTKRIEVKSKDEIGELAHWFNTFLDKLHDIISQIRQSADAVASAANETSLGNQDLSQRTEEQASSLEEISSTIEEVTASLQKSSENSNEADVSSKSTLQTVHQGENVVNELHGAMVEITKGSHAIAEIIAKVNDIAFQTNLLALNAAVEAARAGEQGRGFAVVAAEVRNLAGRTAESAKEIEGLIKESIQKVEHGNDLMEQTATVLNDIVQNTQKTTDVIGEIASSMREQSAAADDIRTAVEQLNQVTQQNASLVEEIAGSSEAVSNEAEEMSSLVGKFKLRDYAGQQVANYVTRLPKKEAHHFSDRLVAAAGESRNSKQAERMAANFNENDFEKF